MGQVETTLGPTIPDWPGDRVDRTRAPLFRAEGVWKSFGPHAERHIGSPDAELSRPELRA